MKAGLSKAARKPIGAITARASGGSNWLGAPLLCKRAIQDAFQRDCAVQSGGSRMASFRDPATLRFFPMPPVEEAGGLEARPVDAIETARVHRDTVRLRAWDIKRVHAAMRAEGVLRHAAAECVDGERILAPQQFEIFHCDGQVKDTLLRAYRAVAL